MGFFAAALSSGHSNLQIHSALENKKFDAQTFIDQYGFKQQEQKDFDFDAFFSAGELNSPA
jgi:hypothetical protein